ncbi:peptidyl-prolyl cis-trans isomerase [Ruegeria arenilitoris]|uniref:peptidylprolyl isomerase n=1 Tax=Ruegeria arenilitoris TaxID=1173585 RepID=UPI003C7CD978
MHILKEPLLHFILIGAAIFGWFAIVGPKDESAEGGDAIVIDDADVTLLVTRFETTWKRPPNDVELQVLIDALVREEILVREARNLGLDRGDQVIRARLAQKMDFLSDAIAASVDPEDAVLEAYVAANSARFTKPWQMAFDQVYLGDQPVPEDVDTTLTALTAGREWSEFGVRSLMPRSMPLSPPGAVDAAFGLGFSAALFPLEPGVWAGPIQSGYGMHLVRVTETRPEYLPPLTDIRDAVLIAWRRDTAEELAQAQYETLAAQYRVETPGSGE